MVQSSYDSFLMKKGPLVCLALFWAMVGCGGGGGASNSPFAGSYRANNGDTISIISNGSFTATVTDSAEGIDTYQGTIQNNGSLTCTGTNSDFPGVTVHGTGQATLSGANLTATISATVNGTTTSGTETFARI